MKRRYELVTIHRPELAEPEVRGLVKEIEQSLESSDAEIKTSEFWGKRRFAYEIDHLREGFYSVVGFEAEPGSTDLLDRALRLSDGVVRHKFIRVERFGTESVTPA